MTRLSGQGIGAHNTPDLAPGFSLQGNLPIPGPHLLSWMLHDDKRVHLLLSAPYAVKWLFKSHDLGILSPLAMDNSPSLRNELWDADAADIPLLHNPGEAWTFICQEIKKSGQGCLWFLTQTCTQYGGEVRAGCTTPSSSLSSKAGLGGVAMHTWLMTTFLGIQKNDRSLPHAKKSFSCIDIQCL